MVHLLVEEELQPLYGNNIMSYDGTFSGGRGVLIFKDPYMSKPTFAAILLSKGIIWSDN